METRSEPRVRLLTSGEKYLGSIPHSHAVRLRRLYPERFVVKAQNRNRYISMIDMQAGVASRLPGFVPFHYREQLGNTRSLVTLKRIVRNYDRQGDYVGETFEEWDQGLTFKEAREGVVVSQATRAARAAKRACA